MKMAFLVIDVQTDFVKRDPFKDVFKEAKEYINHVSSVFRKNNLPVIHIRHVEGEDREGLEVSKKIDQEKTDHYVVKNVGNAFYNTELEELLKKENVDFVLLSGLSAIHCVLATYNGAKERGFGVSMLKNSLIGSKKQVRVVEDSFSIVSYDVIESILNK